MKQVHSIQHFFYMILIICLCGTILAYPQSASASLGQQDYDDLYESLQIISTGWIQEHVNRANQILSKTIYTADDWEAFFTAYFSANPFNDNLREYLGYPVYWWLGDDVHLQLQLGLMTPMENNIASIVSAHQGNLGPALDADADMRQTLLNSLRFLDDMVRVGVIDSTSKSQIAAFYAQHVEAYPQLWRKTETIDINLQPYVTIVRAQLFMNIGDTLPLDASRKTEIAQLLNLIGYYATIWNNHSVLVIDNNGLDTLQLTTIDTYLGSLPAGLHGLHYISVNSLLGNEGDRHQWFANSAGVNIFSVGVGDVTENGFPSEVASAYTDGFSLVLAHEVNHVVDAYFSTHSAVLAARKDELISAAGDEHMNYLRSMFEDGFFANAPQEFFASIANQWFSNSARTLELGLTRWENGYPDPINQFLFFAEVYAQGGSEVPFYTIDEQGVLSRTVVPVWRDSNNHINTLDVNGETYRFALDEHGDVIAVLTNTLYIPLLKR